MGVGVERAFLIFSPRVCSSARAGAMTNNARMTKMAKRIMRLTTDVTLTSSAAAVKVVLRYAQLCGQLLQHCFVNADSSIEIFKRKIFVRRMRATIGQCES